MNEIILQEDTLILHYDLFSLPTAQHKAGLAGLLLMIDSLNMRRIKSVPVVKELTATACSIVFNRESMQTVFDDLYGAEWIEASSKTKWKGQEPKRIEEKEIEANGKKKKERYFIYDAVQPKGEFLQALFPDGDGVWVKLWRDMLWSILRGIPATRGIYEQRAKEDASSVAGEFCKKMLKSYEARKKGKVLTESISSSIFIGAEAENAEKVPFKDTIENSLLLHFWPIVSLIYVPQVLSIEKSREQSWRVDYKAEGYVLAIPEPSNLENFCEEAKSSLRSLKSEIMGFRPRSALIDLFEESGLEYLHHFARNRVDESGQPFAFNLCALELFHLQKQGNRIRQLAVERVLPNIGVLRDYETVRDTSANCFYKSLYMPNLLYGQPWYEGAERIFHQHPMPVFIFIRDKTPRGIRFFGIDVKKKFSAIQYVINTIQGGLMNGGDQDDKLVLRVYKLIQTYVNLRTEEKSGKKYKEFQSIKDAKNRIVYPREYREAREKVCSDAFLAMRGRRDQDFIEYFTGTICSVPQFLVEGDYITVACALMSDWERIKNLSMLALSAHSYLPEND